MKIFFLFSILVSTIAFAQDFPRGPDPRLTPGMLCEKRDVFRYPERIPYCEREVSRDEKNEIFTAYRRLGYRLSSGSREDYKIDHYIPLCAGGSNRAENLWPQHVSVYNITDTIEFTICEKMKIGRLSQKDAVTLLQTVKLDINRAEEVKRYLERI